MKRLFVAVAVALVALGCTGDPNSARGVGGAFVDAHYVRIDLEASKELCTGVARDKVLREIELTSDIAIEGDTQRPRIYYDLTEERGTDEAVQLVYELTIHAPGLDPYEKLTVVTVRQYDGAWLVSNYVEMDPR
jgi:hypothetical protein